MTQIAMPSPREYSAAGLRTQSRALHTPRVLWMNPGWLCVLAAAALSIMGVAAIGTCERPGEPDYEIRQIAFLAVSLFSAVVAAAPHYRILQRLSYPFMFIVLGLLAFVLVPIVPEIIVRPRNGSRRWINLVVTDFQPSEVAKIAYVVALAAYLRFRDHYRNFWGLLSLLVLTFIPMGLILKEPDLGTSLLFLPTLFAMVIAAGARIKHIVLIVAIGLAAAPTLYPFLEPHQKNRIQAMIAQVSGDTRYEDDIGYQGAKAMTLVGAGGVWGTGKNKAAELIKYNHLPEDHNDMVFAVVCCRWGLVGAVVMWGLFALFALGGIWTAAMCKDPFGRLVAVGIIAVISAQMVINTGMTIGLLPITGMTLPFVSYGGSSMVTTWVMVGLIFNIAMRRPQYMARKSFEFDDSE